MGSFIQPDLLEPSSVLKFGQYKGMTVQEVMEDDPQYLLWAVDTGIIDLDSSLYDEVYCKVYSGLDVPFYERYGDD